MDLIHFSYLTENNDQKFLLLGFRRLHEDSDLFLYSGHGAGDKLLHSLRLHYAYI